MKLSCPDCDRPLRKSEGLTKFFGLDVYVCKKCDDWGVYIDEELHWKFKIPPEREGERLWKSL